MASDLTDAELAKYLGIDDCDPIKVARYLAAMPKVERATYNRMAQVEFELGLYSAGLGPKPEGVIVCRDHKHGK